MVNSSEEESNACLLGLLKQTDKAMEKANAEMKAEQARQEKLAKDMKQRGKETHQPGSGKVGEGGGRRAVDRTTMLVVHRQTLTTTTMMTIPYTVLVMIVLIVDREGNDEESGRARRP